LRLWSRPRRRFGAVSEMSSYREVLASASTTWSLVGALSVVGWLTVGVLYVRSRRGAADADIIMKQRRSLIILTGWICLIAIRLATHTFE
jgi:hypothetical protein